jgi:antitoxin (DNA-binding transcriptional repressor) of toxin-antitoxin stability system
MQQQTAQVFSWVLKSVQVAHKKRGHFTSQELNTKISSCAKEPLNKSFVSRVAGGIGIIARSATKVVARLRPISPRPACGSSRTSPAPRYRTQPSAPLPAPRFARPSPGRTTKPRSATKRAAQFHRNPHGTGLGGRSAVSGSSRKGVALCVVAFLASHPAKPPSWPRGTCSEVP